MIKVITKFRSLVMALFLLLFIFAVNTLAEEGDDEKVAKSPTYKIAFEPSLSIFMVDGDKGRFREDHIGPDKVTGGMSEIQFTDGDLEILGKALVNYDYLLNVKYNKPKDDKWYFIFQSRYFKKYYDGSNEPWDPNLYSLPRFYSERRDTHLYIDRFNLDAELGYRAADWISIIFGYSLKTRKGRESLLRGSRARVTGDVVPRTRAIPAIASVDGTVHTYYVEIPFTLYDIHNFTIRQSFEHYHDNQTIRHYRYNNGLLEEDRTFLDRPQWWDIRSTAKYNSFLTDGLYVFAGYMYDYLENQSQRTSIRPVLATPSNYIDPSVHNYRQSHVWNGGFIQSDILGIPDLQMRASVRAEKANTDASSSGYSQSGADGVREAKSALDECWFAESGSLIYKGIPRTTLSFDADFEQKKLHWGEWFDARSHELVTNWGLPTNELQYNTHIYYKDQTYRIRAIHRLNSAVKLTAMYRLKHKIRDYRDDFDTNANFYPGYLGSSHELVNEVTGKVDVRLCSRATGTVKYQHVSDDIEYSIAGTAAQDLDLNRISCSLFATPCDRLTLIGSAMFERFQISTPIAINDVINNRWLHGTEAYDYDGDSAIYSLTANYALAKKTSLFTTYQQTMAMGDNRNVLYEVKAGVRHDWNKNTTMTLAYAFYNFHDKRTGIGVSGGFDDYTAHGILLSLRVNLPE